MAMMSVRTRLLGTAAAAFASFILASVTPFAGPAAKAAEDKPLLMGRVVGTDGKPLAGIPIRARRDNSSMAIAVYTDQKGDYSFPAWSDLTPGAYKVTVELPDFVHTSQPVAVAEGKQAKIDVTLTAKSLAYEDATASEIIAGLPGTDQQKVLFSQCSNCHTLQWALRIGRTKEDWIRVVTKMAGRRAAESVTPDTYAFSQKQFIEPLAAYLTSIRGPEASKNVPFKPRPRPTDTASTAMVVTEYDLPRGGARELYMLRGDPRFVWPHDVIMDDKYAYYTDHFSYMLGRIDRKTGEGKEMPFQLPTGAGRDNMGGGDGRPGNPGGGAHELQFDNQGRVVIGMGRGTVRFDPKTSKFIGWSAGDAMFGLDPQGNVWTADNGNIVKIDTSSEQKKLTMYPIPANDGMYDIDTDSKGRTHLYIWRNGKVAIFDPKKVDEGNAYTEYKVPTAMAGPRRGQIDAQNRLWAAEFYAGRVLMFDPDHKQLKEYPLIEGNKAYSAPYAEPYSASVDDKNGIVWTHDFSSHRMYKIDIKTGKSTEYFTPSNYEVRDLKVETTAQRPTVWVPAYRPPSKLVKMTLR